MSEYFIYITNSFHTTSSYQRPPRHEVLKFHGNYMFLEKKISFLKNQTRVLRTIKKYRQIEQFVLKCCNYQRTVFNFYLSRDKWLELCVSFLNKSDLSYSIHAPQILSHSEFLVLFKIEPYKNAFKMNYFLSNNFVRLISCSSVLTSS